ncbi:MAG: hypothetical protein R3B13_33175 [Polyangiaceae bacterium]
MEGDEFARRLRLFKRHKICVWLGIVGAAAGLFLVPVTRHSLFSLGAPFWFAAAYYAWEGGEAINVHFGDADDGMSTRDYEDMTPSERIEHAKRVGTGLGLGGFAFVALDAVMWFGGG